MGSCPETPAPKAPEITAMQQAAAGSVSAFMDFAENLVQHVNDTVLKEALKLYKVKAYSSDTPNAVVIKQPDANGKEKACFQITYGDEVNITVIDNEEPLDIGDVPFDDDGREKIGKQLFLQLSPELKVTGIQHDNP